MTKFRVVLEIDLFYHPEFIKHPRTWDWNTMLNMGEDEKVTVIDCDYLGDDRPNNDEDDDGN